MGIYSNTYVPSVYKKIDLNNNTSGYEYVTKDDYGNISLVGDEWVFTIDGTEALRFDKNGLSIGDLVYWGEINGTLSNQSDLQAVLDSKEDSLGNPSVSGYVLSSTDTGTRSWISAGTGTVTSVAISGTDGIEVDSGSPITTSGTITLGIDATTLRSTINVADGAEVNTVDSVNTQTGIVVLDADDIDDTSTTNKFVTADDITNLGNLSGTNTGDQTAISDFTGTKTEFDTACTDGDFLYSGDITQYTDEMAQDAVGTILVNSDEISFTYTDATPSITASIVSASIDETKLDTSVNASLDLADSAIQSGDLATVATTGDHTDLSNIGTNTHSAIDTHIADSTIHYTEASISITASQVSDFDTEVSNNATVADAFLKSTDDSDDITEGSTKLFYTSARSQSALTEYVTIACSDETTDLTTGTSVATFRMPFAMTLTAVRASVTTAPTGTTIEVDINESGTTILSTVLSIDAGEKTSTTATTPAVISDSAIADDAEITIDIDQIGSTVAGTGLKVCLIGYRS